MFTFFFFSLLHSRDDAVHLVPYDNHEGYAYIALAWGHTNITDDDSQ